MADYIKRKIREKMDKTSVPIVYLSQRSAKSPSVNWKIEESLKRGKGVIGVFKGDHPPTSLSKAFSDNKCEAVKWSHENPGD